MIRNVLIIVSSIIAIVSIWPYIADIVRDKTKPRVVSWFTWALLASITSAASFTDRQVAAGVSSLLSAIGCLAIVVLGLRHGHKDFAFFDVACQIGALVGLALWFIFNSPAVAIIAAITIDIIGSLPSLKHAWQKPHEETWVTFALSGLSAFITLLAAESLRITAVANPIYIVAINFTFTVVILIRLKTLSQPVGEKVY